MALEQALTFRGLDLTASYRRVAYVGISRKNLTIVVEVDTFADAAVKDSQLPLTVDTFVLKNEAEVKDNDGNVTKAATFRYDEYLAAADSGKDPIALAYDGLKSLPDFTGTKDV